MRQTSFPALPLALAAALGVAACGDSGQHETQISELRTQLDEAQGRVVSLESELGAARSGLAEMEQMRAELEEARSRAAELELSPTASAPVVPGEAAEDVQAELEEARGEIAELRTRLAAGGAASTSELPGAAGATSGAGAEPLAAALSDLRAAEGELTALGDRLAEDAAGDVDVEGPLERVRAASRRIAQAVAEERNAAQP